MKKRTQGFTLVEIVVTIAVLAVLSSMAFLLLRGTDKSAETSVLQHDIQSVETALVSQSGLENKSFVNKEKVFPSGAGGQDKNLLSPAGNTTLYAISEELAQHISLDSDRPLSHYGVDEYNRVYYVGDVSLKDYTPPSDPDQTPETPNGMTEPTPKPTPTPKPDPTPMPTPRPTDQLIVEPTLPDGNSASAFDWESYVNARTVGYYDDEGVWRIRDGNTVTSVEDGGKGDGKPAGTLGDGARVGEDYFSDIETMYGGSRGICFMENGVCYIIKEKTTINLTTLKNIMDSYGDAEETIIDWQTGEAIVVKKKFQLKNYYESLGMFAVDFTSFYDFAEYNPDPANPIYPYAPTDPLSPSYEKKHLFVTFEDLTYESWGNVKIENSLRPLRKGTVMKRVEKVEKDGEQVDEERYYVWYGADNNSDMFTYPNANNNWLWINTQYSPKIY